MDASDINHGGAFVPDEDVYQGEGDWADAEAWRIANTDEADDIMQEIIAAALRAAERRGLERAAEVAEENAAKARSQESAGQEWRGFDAEMYEATARWLRALMDSQRDRAVTIKPP